MTKGKAESAANAPAQVEVALACDAGTTNGQRHDPHGGRNASHVSFDVSA
jgi:hypothetical protein